MNGLSPHQRVREYADRSAGVGACWPWTRALDRNGYGKLQAGGRHQRGAHCVAYETTTGPIPPGYEVDHLCHNADPSCNARSGCLHRRCVNPAHLEAVPKRTNTLRGKGFAAVNAQLKACRQGHLFDEANTYLIDGKRRQCRTCQLDAVRRYNARKRSAS